MQHQVDNSEGFFGHSWFEDEGIPGLPNTDPNRYPPGSLNRLNITNSYYYLSPGLELVTAKQIYAESTNPRIVKNIQ